MFNPISISLLVSLVAAVFPDVHAAPLAPRNLKIREVNGSVVPGKWIVKLKDSVDISTHISSLPFSFSVEDISSPIFTELFGSAFKGYAGEFSDDDLHALQASPDVDYIEQEQTYSIYDQQTGATWGLQSISSIASSPVGAFEASTNLDYTYTYSEPSGEGVDIYIIDTGIDVSHPDFEGRATFGFAANTYPQRDGNGHGTHCAGSAAGKTYGVAKKANLVAVKVLTDTGSGTTSDIISGVNWVTDAVKASNRPSIASMSLGGGVSDTLEAAIQLAIDAGVTFVVAAGNSNLDASTQSPARMAAAVTVGAANITNTKAWFSNYGPVVDIWAPGVNIVSTWPLDLGNLTGTNVLSGTSMATPHISGLAAYLLSKDTSLKPDTLSAKITSLGQSNVLGGIPDGTVNLLAYNGGAGSADQATTSVPIDTATPTVPADTETTTATDAPTSTSTDSSLAFHFACPSWWPHCPWGQ